MPKKILIIEDDPVIVKYLQAVFSDNGYATCTATSSMEGLEVVRHEKPDHPRFAVAGRMGSTLLPKIAKRQKVERYTGYCC